MPEKFIHIAYILNVVISFSIGILLLVIKTSASLKSHNYHRGKSLLAIATIITGMGNAATVFFGMENDMVDIFTLVGLITAALQACFFTFLVLTLFHSNYPSTTNVLKHLCPTLIFILSYIIVVQFKPDVQVYSYKEIVANINNPALILRIAFGLTYIVQLVLYTRIFIRERQVYRNKLDNYFSDISGWQLQFGATLFYQSLSIGIAVALFCFYPGKVQDFILTNIVTIFYFSFSVSYINYQYTLLHVMPAMRDAQNDASTDNEVTSDCVQVQEQLQTQLLITMEKEELYLKQGVVLEDIALHLKIPKRQLSQYINMHFDRNFNTWINSMRIDHAQRLLDTCSQCTLQEIAERSGFADNAMMSKEFKRRTGETPSAYRRKVKMEIEN